MKARSLHRRLAFSRTPKIAAFGDLGGLPIHGIKQTILSSFIRIPIIMYDNMVYGFLLANSAMI